MKSEKRKMKEDGKKKNWLEEWNKKNKINNNK